MSGTAPPAVVVTAWDDAVAHWDEPARHDALLAAVVSTTTFAWAAAKYKERTGDPIADKYLERLRKAAMATMMVTATPRPDDAKVPYRNTMLVLVVLLILIGVGVIYAKVHEHNTATETRTNH